MSSDDQDLSAASDEQLLKIKEELVAPMLRKRKGFGWLREVCFPVISTPYTRTRVIAGFSQQECWVSLGVSGL